MNIMFETGRLYIRDFIECDQDRIASIIGQSGFYYSYFAKGGTARSFIEDSINLQKIGINKARNVYRLAICLKGDDKLIGSCVIFSGAVNYINIIDKYACELGIFIDPKYQRKGYASECSFERTRFAFGIFDCDCLYTTVHPKNEASTKLQYKQGFEYVMSGNLDPIKGLIEDDRHVYRLTKNKWVERSTLN